MATSRLDLILNAQSAITSARQYQKALANIGTEAKRAQAALDLIGKKPVKVKVSLTGAGKVRSDATALAKLTGNLSKPIRIQVTSNGLKSVKMQADSILKAIDSISRRSLTIKAKVTGLKELNSAVSQINRSVGAASGKGVTIKVSVVGVKETQNALEAVKKSALALTRLAPKVTFSASGLTSVKQQVTSLRNLLQNIGKTRTKVTLSATGITPVKNELNAIAASLARLSRARISITADPRSLASLTTSLAGVRRTLGELSNRSINIRTNLTSIRALETALARVNAAVRTINARTIRIDAGRSNLTALVSQVRALQSSVDALTRSLATMGRTASRATSNLAGIGGAARASAAGTNILGGGLGSITGFVPQLRAAAVAIGLIGTGSALSGFVRLADSAQQIENRLKLVTNSTAALVEVQGELFRQSRDARTSLSAQADLYQRIALSAKQLGVSQGEVLAGTEAVSKAITISAATQQAANATIIQFGQALSFGKLRGDELRSVLEQAPRLAQALADGLGIARGELVKFGFEGKLASDKVFKALLSQLPKLREEFALITPRITESSVTVINSFTLMAQAINETTGITESFSRSILDFGDTVSASIPSVVSDVAKLKLLWIDLRNVLNAPLNIPFLDTIVTQFDKVNAFFNGAFTKSILGFSNDMMQGLAGISAGFSTADAVDQITNLQRELSELSSTRQTMIIAIDAYEAQKSLKSVRMEVDGIPNRAAIEVVTNGQKALKELPEIRRKMAELTKEQIKIEVRLDFSGQKQILEDEKFAYGSLLEKQGDLGVNLKRQIDLRAAAIALVEDEGSQIKANTAAEKEKLQVQLRAINAIKSSLSIVPEPTKTPAVGRRSDITGAGDADKDAKTLQKYIDKQRTLLATTGDLTAAERELAELRSKTGGDAVDSVSAVIEAYALLNSTQEASADILADAESRVEKLREERDKINEVTAAEQIRQTVAEKGVRTEAEETRLQALKAYLLTIETVSDATEAQINITKQLGEARELAAKLSPEEAQRLKNLEDEASAIEKALSATKRLNDERERADDLVQSTIDSNKSDSVKRGEDIATLESRLTELQATPMAAQSDDTIGKIEDTQLALEQLREAQGIIIDFGITGESLIRDTAQAMSSAMSTFFFDIMQGDFEDLTKNMKDTFKKAIDRMVADALAAKLTESLFNAGAGIIGLFGGGAAPAAQFGEAVVSEGEVRRVNEIGQESFVNREGQRQLIKLEPNSLFTVPEDGRIDTAARTKSAMLSANDALMGKVMGVSKFGKDVGKRAPPPKTDRGLGASLPTSSNVFDIKGKSYLNLQGAGDAGALSMSGTRNASNRTFSGGTDAFGSVRDASNSDISSLLSIGSDDFMSRTGVSTELKVANTERVPNVQNISMTVVSPDVDGFRKSSSQIQNNLGRLASSSTRRNG